MSCLCLLLFSAPGSFDQYFCLYFLQMPPGKLPQPWEWWKSGETKTSQCVGPSGCCQTGWNAQSQFFENKVYIAPFGLSEPGVGMQGREWLKKLPHSLNTMQQLFLFIKVSSGCFKFLTSLQSLAKLILKFWPIYLLLLWWRGMKCPILPFSVIPLHFWHIS